jgi:hypothetical protein
VSKFDLPSFVLRSGAATVIIHAQTREEAEEKARILEAKWGKKVQVDSYKEQTEDNEEGR